MIQHLGIHPVQKMYLLVPFELKWTEYLLVCIPQKLDLIMDFHYECFRLHFELFGFL